tara:strand:- start:163 stop:402 length:240 start_codon:yes stop_codon:yes gene_type:complete
MKKKIIDINTGVVTEADDDTDYSNRPSAYDIMVNKRAVNYPPLADFADAMYWNSKGDDSKLTAYYAACEKVKTDNPKPE